jgi:hypothetical protein
MTTQAYITTSAWLTLNADAGLLVLDLFSSVRKDMLAGGAPYLTADAGRPRLDLHEYVSEDIMNGAMEIILDHHCRGAPLYPVGKQKDGSKINSTYMTISD